MMQLVVSEGTVKNHVSNILGQLSLRDRTQEAIYAIENNLFDQKLYSSSSQLWLNHS